MDRDNHYERAFEAYLRRWRIPYIAVDEGRRSLLGDQSIKSLDFLVRTGERTWLVDVKGRRFPSGRQRQYWKNWSTWDDLRGLSQWEQLLGGSSQGVFVFAYDVLGDRAPLPADQLFVYQQRRYAFVAVPLARYLCFARTISPRWDTVAISGGQFRRLAQPAAELFARSA